MRAPGQASGNGLAEGAGLGGGVDARFVGAVGGVAGDFDLPHADDGVEGEEAAADEGGPGGVCLIRRGPTRRQEQGRGEDGESSWRHSSSPPATLPTTDPSLLTRNRHFTLRQQDIPGRRNKSRRNKKGVDLSDGRSPNRTMKGPGIEEPHLLLTVSGRNRALNAGQSVGCRFPRKTLELTRPTAGGTVPARSSEESHPPEREFAAARGAERREG